MTVPDFTPALRWMRERETVHLRKERGDPPPWSSDPVIAEGRFCNVRREDDKVTIWIRQHIRESYADHPYLWMMLGIGRWINWPPTLQELIDRGAWPLDDSFDPRSITTVLNDREARGEKVFTGAYTINAPQKKGARKNAHVAEVVLGDGLWRRREDFAHWFGRSTCTLQGTYERLKRAKFWGHFVSYQVTVDLRFTPLLSGAEDVSTWAAAGPGTIRGLNRMHGRPVKYKLSQDQALSELRALYKVAQAETGIRIDFSDIANICCETDKWLRVKLGEGKMRAKYTPSATAGAATEISSPLPVEIPNEGGERTGELGSPDEHNPASGNPTFTAQPCSPVSKNDADDGEAAPKLVGRRNEHLTAAEAHELDIVRRRTYRGQASWAIGPYRCRECIYWNDVGGHHRLSPTRTCAKYYELMNRTRGAAVPASAFSCRFFKPTSEQSS
jgi:alpha-glutamyl/putrescinyl thymine pyrophosphorylase clade 1